MLRFKDNNDLYPEYVERSLDECFFIRNEKQIPTADYPLMAFTAEGGVCEKGERYDRSALVKNANKLYKRTELNDFIYSSNNLDVGSIGLNKYGSAVISDVYEIFRINTDVVIPEYISECMQFPQNLNKMLRYRQGALYGQYRIHPENFLKIKINVPCYQEQEKIVDFLSSVDSIIADYEAQIITTQNQKKGVIQKLFLQEVRFKSDDGLEYPEWKETIFSDCFIFLTNNTLSRDCLNYESGNVKNIHYGDILTKYGSLKNIKDVDVPFINKEIELKKPSFLSNGDVVIADTAEDEACGKAVEICGVDSFKVVSGLHTYACRPQITFAKGFIGYYLNSEAYRKQLYRLMQGTKVTSLNRKFFSESKMKVPCYEEQQKIASCLSAYDDVIEDLENTVEHWKIIKKGLLQQLFA